MTDMRRSTSGTSVELKPHLDDKNGIMPPSGPAAGGQPVTLHGTGLAKVRRIVFGGEEATQVRAMNATTVTCMTPSNKHGACKVYAINEDEVESNRVTFTYE